MSAADTTTAIAVPDADDEINRARDAASKRLPIPAGNRVLAPATWEMFGRIANTVANTEFVPKGLRGKPAAVMACLLYGDAQGLHPSVALTEIHIVDGKPTMSATLMVGKIRDAKIDRVRAGHKLRREEIRDENGAFVGCTAHGVRGDDGEADSFTFTIEMAARAGLLTKHNWISYPEAMCWARCVSQLARMLFPDVFLGQSAYTAEELGLEETDESGAALPEETPEQPAAGADDGAPKDEAGDHQEHKDDEVEPKAAQTQDDEAGGQQGGEHQQGEHQPAEPSTDEATVVVVLGDDEITVAESELDAFLEAEKLEQVGYEIDNESGQKTIQVRELDPGAQATLDAAAAIVRESMPPVMAAVTSAVERGDRPFVQAVLDHEVAKGDKARKRLVDAISGMLEGMGDGPAQTEPAEDPQPEPEPAPAAVEPAGFQAEPDPQPQVEEPLAGAGIEAKQVRLKAACAWLEDQMPELRQWRLEAVIGAASRQFGVQAHAIEDLDEDHLDKIWEAVPDEAKQGLALVSAEQIGKLAGVQEPA